MEAGDIPLSKHHEDQINTFLRFARTLRSDHLKEATQVFDDYGSENLLEENYTTEEVNDILESLKTQVRSALHLDLPRTFNSVAQILRQIFAKAEANDLELSFDLAAIDSRISKEQEDRLDKTLLAGTSSPGVHTSSTAILPGLGNINAGDVDVLQQLNKLKDDYKSVRFKLKTVLEQHAVQIKEKYDKIVRLEDAVEAGEAKILETQNDAAKRADLDKRKIDGLKDSLEKQKQVGEVAKDRIAELEKEAAVQEKKIMDSAQFLNMRQMLQTKNRMVKQLRAKLAEAGVDFDDKV